MMIKMVCLKSKEGFQCGSSSSKEQYPLKVCACFICTLPSFRQLLCMWFETRNCNLLFTAEMMDTIIFIQKQNLFFLSMCSYVFYYI